MRINSIQSYNNCNKPAFNARLSGKDAEMLIEEIKGSDASLAPKLYTMLEYLHELGGKKAEFIKTTNYFQLLIDKKPATGNNMFISRYNALYSALVKHKNTIVKKSDIIRMPESIFEQKWWENRNKTVEDIKNLSTWVV